MYIPIGYGFSHGYLLIIIATFIIGGIASGWVNRELSKYRKYPVSNGLTGTQAANNMLHYYGIGNVALRAGGSGQDFFDPRNNSITLSPDAYGARSITATATACHECGHACQYADSYMPMKFRAALVPVVNFASYTWIFILIIGILMNFSGLIYAAIVVYGLVLLFQMATLPVEFNASNRAIAYMESINMPDEDIQRCKKVLRACAFTYVAAALASLLQILWILAQKRD